MSHLGSLSESMEEAAQANTGEVFSAAMLFAEDIANSSPNDHHGSSQSQIHRPSPPLMKDEEPNVKLDRDSSMSSAPPPTVDMNGIEPEPKTEPASSSGSEDEEEEEEEKTPKSKSSTPSSLPPPPTNPRKAPKGPTQTIGDLPIAREEALASFKEISDSVYQYKSLGVSRELFESGRCDCVFEHGFDDAEVACGRKSDCINRLTQVECVDGECRWGASCRNQRFQNKEYAPIEIVQTEMKGYGLRAEEFLHKDSFIYEYVGEVVSTASFKKRMRDYAEEGIQHFYFMMLQKDEFIDATKSGGIGRFANHSCNPNCYVAKWTVGNRVRMGIFAKRNILQHEELTFNYNVDRYGHEAQTCWCGEPNCVGFIGGKTQTDVATMDDLYLDALGITDDADIMELKGTKKKKGKKIDDPDFMPNLRPIEPKDAIKVVTAIKQTQNKKVLSKLLTRIKISDNESTLREIMRVRGYSLMKNILDDYMTDLEIVLLTLEGMARWPIMYRNKIEDSQIEPSVQECMVKEDEPIKNAAKTLLDHWLTLPTQQRISKRPKGEDGQPTGYIIDDILSDRPTKKSRYEEESEKSLFAFTDAASLKETLKARVVPRAPVAPTPKPKDEYVPPMKHQPSSNDIANVIAMAKRKKQEEDAAAALAREAEARAAAEAKALKEKKRAAYSAKKKERLAAKKAAKAAKETPEQKEAKKEKQLTKLVGAVVVKVMSNFSKSMDRDVFKKHAKELTLLIVGKEKKQGSFKEGRLDVLSDEKVTKMKKFIKEYMSKLVRKIEKSKHRPNPTSDATPSTSTANATPTREETMTVEEAMDMVGDQESDSESDDDDDDGDVPMEPTPDDGIALKGAEPINVIPPDKDIQMNDPDSGAILPWTDDLRRRPIGTT